MSILFDLTAIQPLSGKYHGAGEYAKSVLRALLAARCGRRIVGFYDPTRPLDAGVSALLDGSSVERRPVRGRQDLERVIQEESIDRVYSALPYEYYNVNFGRAEVIFTIHGIRPVELPTERYESRYPPRWRHATKRLLKIVCRSLYVSMHRRRFGKLLLVPATRRTIVVPSNHTKYSILSAFPGIAVADMRVLYSPRRTAEEALADDASAVLSGGGLDSRSYLLLVSGGRWVKNAFRAVRAIDSIFRDFPDIEQKVVITGVERPPAFLRSVKHRDRFVIKGYVDSSALAALYRHAFCLVYPTLNEGFGYPPLECMSVGTPVVCSAVTSLTEICGDGPLYFNPYSISEIRNRILRLLLEPEDWQACAERGRRQSLHIAARQDEMLRELCDLILR